MCSPSTPRPDPDDILIRITVANRGPDAATLASAAHAVVSQHLDLGLQTRRLLDQAEHSSDGRRPLVAGRPRQLRQPSSSWPGRVRTGRPRSSLFTENETNTRRLFGTDNWTPYVKDAFHEYLIHGQTDAVNPDQVGTKVAAHYRLEIPAGEDVVTIRLRLRGAPNESPAQARLGKEFDRVFHDRHPGGDEFYADTLPARMHARRSAASCARRYAGLLWSKQFYHYIVRDWLDGDPQQPPPPASRKQRAATPTGPISTTAT